LPFPNDSRRRAVFIDENGMPVIAKVCGSWSDPYEYVDWVSCKDYELHVAISKDEKGQWIYHQIGD
jgi:hypothetical protein